MLLAVFFSAAINWNADLDALQREIPNVHPNAFHATTRDAYDAAIAKLRTSAPSMPQNVVVAEMARIVASIGDGHTRLVIPVDPNAGELHFRSLPVRFTWFSDGVFITSAANKELIGQRVTKIGSMSIDDAINAMAPLAAADNDAMRRLVITEFLAIPELLNAVKIAPSADRVAVNGVMLDAVPFEAEVKDPRPFWFEPRGKFVYVALNQVANAPDETLAAFADRLFKYVDQHHSDGVMLDLRANGGGNNALLKPLVHGFIRHPNLPLFVLIGRRTFSSAVDLATELEQNTNAIFVGEPTGGRPNSYGDSRRIVLPSSGITVRVATLYWQRSDPRDFRDSIPPHLTVSQSSADFIAHRDLALQTAMHVAEAMRKKGTLDGNWTGIITIDWKRIPITISDHQITIPDLGVKSVPIQQPKFTIDSTEGPLQFDLRVGDGIISGTMTAQGRMFPILITRRVSPAT